MAESTSRLIGLLDYIEQVEKLKRKPVSVNIWGYLILKISKYP
jgi:hypothetical protein